MSTTQTVTENEVDYESLKADLRLAINNFVNKYVKKVIDDDDIERFRSTLEELVKHYGVVMSKIEKGDDFEIPEVSIVMDMDEADDEGQVDLKIEQGNDITEKIMTDIFSPDLADEFNYKFTGK